MPDANKMMAGSTLALVVLGLIGIYFSQQSAKLDTAYLSPIEPTFDNSSGVLTIFIANWGKEVSGEGKMRFYVALAKTDGLAIYGHTEASGHLIRIPPTHDTGPHVLPSMTLQILPWAEDERNRLESKLITILAAVRLEYDNRQRLVDDTFCLQAAYDVTRNLVVWNLCDPKFDSDMKRKVM